MPYKKSPSETISKVIQANVVPIEGGWKRGEGGVKGFLTSTLACHGQ